ncbi:hypothetical protein Tco_0187807, partial [Tanacetum coccineum]
MRAATSSIYTLSPRSETPPSGIPPLLPISLPTPSPPLLLPSTDHRADRLEVCLPPQKRTDYGFVATLDAEIRRDPERDVGAPATDDTELGRRMIEFSTMVRQDTDEIYERLKEREARLSHKAWRQSMAASDAARYEVIALCTTVLGQRAEISAL